MNKPNVFQNRMFMEQKGIIHDIQSNFQTASSSEVQLNRK
jgi:hypothetical protein